MTAYVKNNRQTPSSSCPQDQPWAVNMPSMPSSQLLLYAEINTLSARMAAAARAQDWDSLRYLAQQVAHLRDALPATTLPAAALAADELQQKTLLIQRILDDDAEIRRHTEPWMERLSGLLSMETRDRPVSGSPLARLVRPPR